MENRACRIIIPLLVLAKSIIENILEHRKSLQILLHSIISFGNEKSKSKNISVQK